ncbi:hypothetical protein Dimus_034987 [Dionaea muscipula]
MHTPHDQTDYGTPQRHADVDVTLEIDGCAVTVPAGTSVMRAAIGAGINVPKLCATDSLEPFGSCRLCLVEIEGRRGYPASCTTPVEAGMKVRTQSGRLQTLRRNVMELYISDHPLDCLTCPANGDCELQDMAGVTGLREVRYGYAGQNHLQEQKDESNPYFTYDPSKCIVCNRCVRACEETQGTFALTIAGRGFDSRVAASESQPFMDSECVSCGACVAACPTATLQEKSVVMLGQAEHAVVTTCAYCGVGCSLRAEMKGNEVVRMVPQRDGEANAGHACVKGRFAWGYATHRDRITKPMIRAKITDPWREVSWDEAIRYAASEFRRIQEKYGRDSIGGITSSRCTNEETYLVQKLVRAAFGNNNVDTCARVCHSPTGYDLRVGGQGGRDHGDRGEPDGRPSGVRLAAEAAPARGAKLIVVDPRRIDIVDGPHVRAAHHLQLRPGTNVALVNALAHVIVTEGLLDEAFIAARCEARAFGQWRAFVAQPENAPEATGEVTGVAADAVRAAARLYATGGNAAIYYGLGVTEHAQGSTTVMGIANLAMATGNIGREGVGVNPLRGQNNVQGSCDMGSFPHELPGYRHVGDAATRALFEQAWQVALQAEPGLRIPNMFDAALDGSFRGLYCQGRTSCRHLPERDGEVRARAAAGRDVPGEGRHVHERGAAHLAGAAGDAAAGGVRGLGGDDPAGAGAGLRDGVHASVADHGRDRAAHAELRGVSYAKLDALGSIQWPCNAQAPGGTPTMHVDEFVRGLGHFVITKFVASPEKVTRRYPLILTTGRILSQYNVGAQTRRTENSRWHDEDRLEIHPHDAQERGIRTGDWVGIESRAGQTVLRAKVTQRMQPGVVYTTFHFPESGANVITTESSDWATNCPEYKVTAVQVMPVEQPSQWQREYTRFNAQQLELLERREAAPETAGK